MFANLTKKYIRANGALSSDKKYKTDYVVYIKSIHINHDVVVGEFKAPNINSQVESDLVKLGKERVGGFSKSIIKMAVFFRCSYYST